MPTPEMPQTPPRITLFGEDPPDPLHAFPSFAGEEGMTLRDYFAAKAMQALLGVRCFPRDASTPAEAWAVADAMLAAREVKP